jgi:pyridoxal phosphate enzyme (YggS family)
MCPSLPLALVEDRLQEIRSRVPEGVTLVAVSKGQSIEAIEQVYRAGQRDFGENYVQELLEKAEALQARGCTELRWHFIGHLQTNKVKALMPWVSCVQSVSSLKLAQELSKRWATSGRTGKLRVYLQVNQDAEETKSGVSEQDAPSVAREIAALPGLELLGLMSIPDPDVEGGTAPAFARLRELEKSCRPHTQGALSMGMSSDFEAAIRLGSTLVRVGTALFGPRALRAPKP